MALLRFIHEEHSTIDNWDIMLEAKYAPHMNGFRRKINAEVDKREDVNWTGYELKVDKVSRKDFDEPLDQCRGYTEQHGVGIPELAGVVPKSRVTIVNAFYDDNYSHFTVKCGERIEEFDVVSDS
ncbi:hypothetical protein V8E54_008171 [Elaphomyces granulatus]